MTAQTMEPVLADLESRAGASDKDRAAWLAERRTGITATEVKELYMRKIGRRSNKSMQDLIDEKLGRRTDTFKGNKYTDWGNLRESVIVARLAGEGFSEEHRVFHGAMNSRHLASPDGLGVNFDGDLEVLEIKTAGYDLPPGSVAFDEKGHEWQVLWNLWVTGAVRGRYTVEERVEEPDGSFSPGPEHRYWIERDEEKIAELVAVADEFLAELDRQAEAGAPEIDEAVDTHAVNYLRAIGEEKQWAALKKKSYDALVDAGVSQESAVARVTFTPGVADEEVEEEVVDLEAAEAAHPKETAALKRALARAEKLQAEWDALADQYVKKVRSVRKGKKARVTVTAVKEKKQ